MPTRPDTRQRRRRRAGEIIETTAAETEQLNEATQKISDVVRLINDIAEQTNLLALNATIEAARAGEAGKGFAVVAQEVKALATQTASATQVIGTQVTGLQQRSQTAVAGMTEVRGIVETLQTVALYVGRMVEEQSGATRRVGHDFDAATGRMQALNDFSSSVAEATTRTGTGAERGMTLAEDMNQVAKTTHDAIMRLIERACRLSKDAASDNEYNGYWGWWSRWESNPRPLECDSSALPTELRPRTAADVGRRRL